MAKHYYWLKLKKDFFDSLQMRKLRRVAGGDTYTIIYLKLMLLSLNTGGVIAFEGLENNIAEELAIILSEDIENVKITIASLEGMGLLEKGETGELILKEVPVLTGSETDKAALMRKKRELDRLLEDKNNDCDGNNVTKELPDVTFRYTEKEKETEKELDLESDLESESETNKNKDLCKSKTYTHKPKIDYQKILDLYNEKCPSLRKAILLTEKRKTLIRSRLKNYSVEDVTRVFEIAEQSPFLRGEKNNEEHPNWVASFDFIMREDKFVATLEGSYDGFCGTRNKKAQQLDEEYNAIAAWAAGDEEQ